MTVLTSASLFAAGIAGPVAGAYMEQDSYIAESFVTGGQEPINIIVTETENYYWSDTLWERVRLAYLDDINENPGTGKPTWYHNPCFDVTMALGGYWAGYVAEGSLSTDNGDDGNVFPFVDCGSGDRNHFRAYGPAQDKTVFAYDRRQTLYLSASLETIEGEPVYDMNGTYVGDCVDEVHCLTRSSFDMGRDGYSGIPSGILALSRGWIERYGWPFHQYFVELDPPPTDWIEQGLAVFRGDGHAFVIEASWDLAYELGMDYTASSEASGAPAALAFDGTSEGKDLDNDSRWQSADTEGPHWLMVDLGDPLFEDEAYDHVQIVNGAFSTTTGYTDTIRDWSFQVSTNGTSWTTVASATDEPDGTGVIQFSVGERTERYARVLINEVNGTDQASIFALKLFRRP